MKTKVKHLRSTMQKGEAGEPDSGYVCHRFQSLLVERATCPIVRGHVAQILLSGLLPLTPTLTLLSVTSEANTPLGVNYH